MLWPRFLALRTILALGFDVRRVARPGKLRIEAERTDPVTVEYCLSKRGYAVFQIPLEDSRAFHAMGLRLRSEEHPFVRALESALRLRSGADRRGEIERILNTYYDLVQPLSALDIIGLSADKAPGLEGAPAFGYLLPWSEGKFQELIEGREKSLRYVGMRYGIGAAANAGHPFFGPIQAPRLALQVTRLGRLLDSVQRRGFRPFGPDSPPKVSALRRNGEYRWLIEEGQHRFALGSALEVKSIAAMMISVVRREDAHLWPQVVSGVFTQEGALKLFDRIFDGVPPSLVRNWIKSV